MTLEFTLLLISRFWSISLFHHISGIAVVPPTKFSKIACSIAAHYLKWVGHLQELRCNDTSFIQGFGQKSGSDPNCATEKWVGVKTWCLIAARLQSSCQVLHKSNLFLQHGCRAARQILNKSNLCQQYGCRADCQVPNWWNLVSQHRCGGTCQVLRKSNYSHSMSVK